MKLLQSLELLMMLAVASVLPRSACASERSVRWKVDGLVANGNGCKMGDTMAAMIAGDEVQLVFWNMGIDLPADSSSPFAQRKACVVTVAAEISPGFYPKRLKQKLRFGGMKSMNASAAIAAQGSFFGLPLKPLSVALESGSVFNEMSAMIEAENTFPSRFANASPWCSPNANPNGLLSTRIVTQGLRETDSDELILSSGRYDLKYYGTLFWDPCGIAE